MNDTYHVSSSDYDEVAEYVYVDYAIVSDFLDPGALTTQLEIQPSRAWAAGEQYVSKAYNPRTRTVYNRLERRPWRIWGIDTKSLSTKDPELHLTHLLNLLEP